ncbi:PAS domain S-box protein [Gloeothece verrucosa]|uniref:histidine kinase n=1 Tax=Gloeothece verrucosa (strain PCC 7822) TaxID=497965 RepID=E0UEY6_GLOV7|nr:PAS domain S-box protein [Gloeothece verrucosa]ADN13116.1 multi-sensor hybrid histidine kinase [Gloeothece verrucosa PCC 7822]
MPQNQRTILVVDNSQQDRETYRSYLLQDKKHAYNIFEAETAQQTLDLCSQQFPDVIVLGNTLSDHERLEILNQLKAIRGTDDLPVVLLMDQDHEALPSAIKTIVSEYLIKSKTRADNLRLAIDYAIERDRLNRQLESDITARQQAQEVLKQQLLRQRLVVNMLERIRKSLKLTEILHTTVEEVRQFLDTDRVIIFRFDPDWSGDIVVESVGQEWTAILSTTIRDPCFTKANKGSGSTYIEMYRQGLVTSINNIYTAKLQQCHLDLLAQFQVKANLVVPILQAEYLWGLLIAHHCASPRQWQPQEIDLLQQLAIQVGIAIHQSTIYEQLQSELIERRKAQQALREARDSLEKRVLQRTAELANTNQDLQKTLAELQIAQKQLSQQNEALINARKMADAERRRYQDLFSEAPDGYLVTDVAAKIQEANRAASALLRVSQEELVGQSLLLYIAPVDRQIFERQLAQLQPLQDWEVHLKPPNGSAFVTVIAVTIINDSLGQPVGLRWLLRDISDRKQAEQKIQQQAALIDISTDAIFVCDLENNILFWSEGATRLYGWTIQETLGKKANELFYTSSSFPIEPSLNIIINKNTWYGELEQITKDNRKIIVESRWTLVRDETGQPQSILVVNTDITEKKYLEVQFYRAQRLESIGTLASGIAHDLNNILQPILFISHLLKQKFPYLDEQTKERLKMLEDSSRRGTSLVRQILSFACGEEGSRAHVQVKHILREVIQVAQKTFPKSINIQMKRITSDLWTVHADATQLHQVFMNLMVNARDAMPEGGNLSLSAENLFIDETFARMDIEAHVGFYVVISFTDTGTGISSEIIERIFDPFFTTKEPGKGTGLGLSTVRGIVKNHGGFVRVSSVLGKGSQFKVYLPAVDGQETQETQDLELPNGRNELILIVDDEASIREITKTSLEEHNYRTLVAKDGVEALVLYAKYSNDIELVLMDLMMPEMDGVTAIRALKKINSQIKIVVTSGIVSNTKLDEAEPVNVTSFLSKPYTEKELLETLNQILSR